MRVHLVCVSLSLEAPNAGPQEVGGGQRPPRGLFINNGPLPRGAGAEGHVGGARVTWEPGQHQKGPTMGPAGLQQRQQKASEEQNLFPGQELSGAFVISRRIIIKKKKHRSEDNGASSPGQKHLLLKNTVWKLSESALRTTAGGLMAERFLGRG